MIEIKRRIEIDGIHIEIYKKVIPILEKNGIKEITKRLATAIEKEMPGYYVLYNPEKYGNREISIYNDILKYDNKLSIDYCYNFGDMWRLKTEEESILETIKNCKARLENTIESKKQLEKELEQFKDIKKDYIKLIKDIKNNINAFNKKYGTKGGCLDNVCLSYTTRKELENIEVLPNNIY